MILQNLQKVKYLYFKKTICGILQLDFQNEAWSMHPYQVDTK